MLVNMLSKLNYLFDIVKSKKLHIKLVINSIVFILCQALSTCQFTIIVIICVMISINPLFSSISFALQYLIGINRIVKNVKMI